MYNIFKVSNEEMIEEWKIYKDTRCYRKDNTVYQGHLYEVSNLGNVKIDKKLISFDYESYYSFGKHWRVHRAVAELFVLNPYHKTCVDHIDTDIHNNKAENLRWVTPKENSNNPITRLHMSNSAYGKIITNETRKNMSIAHIGHTLTESSKQIISKKNKGNKSISEYYWVHKNNERKLIKKETINFWLNNGWLRGMGSTKKKTGGK